MKKLVDNKYINIYNKVAFIRCTLIKNAVATIFLSTNKFLGRYKRGEIKHMILAYHCKP